MQEGVGDNIVFIGDKVYVWVILFNIIKPSNDTIWHGVVGGYVKVVGVNVQFGTKKHGTKFHEDHNNGE